MKGSSSRRQDRDREWKRNAEEATKTFGQCSIRPQDKEAKFRRLQMIKNLTAVQASSVEPPAFRPAVLKFIESAPCPDPHLVDVYQVMKRTDCIGLVSDRHALEECVTAMEAQSVLAVDYEFHLKYSYDGFIAVAQAASLEKTYVFDAIRLAGDMKNGFADIMRSPNIIKVFCGMDNDVLRMKKDWNCYMVGAVDLQHMYNEWKSYNFLECLETSRRAIEERLTEDGKPSDPNSVKAYLLQLQKPGLEMLMSIFYHGQIRKNSTVTYSDWRNSPLHPDQLKYAASDAFYCIRIFYLLYDKIGVEGLQTAFASAVPFLYNTQQLQKQVPTSYPSGPVGEAVKTWREYLAFGLDRQTEDIVRGTKVVQLCTDIGNLKQPAPAEDLEPLMHNYSVVYSSSQPKLQERDRKKAARYLALQLDAESLEKTKFKDCHICGRLGHVAWWCPFPEDEKLVKMNQKQRPELKKSKLLQDFRRYLNWCKNKGRDPTNSTPSYVAAIINGIKDHGWDWDEIIARRELWGRNWEQLSVYLVGESNE